MYVAASLDQCCIKEPPLTAVWSPMLPEPPLLNTLEVLFVWASHFRHSIGYRPYRWWLAIGYW